MKNNKEKIKIANSKRNYIDSASCYHYNISSTSNSKYKCSGKYKFNK